MKYLLALSVLLASCTVARPAQGPAPNPSATAAAADVVSKTVGLVDIDERPGRVYCSGVWVSPDLILTANHCVDDIEIGDFVGYAVRADVNADAGDELPFSAIRLSNVLARDEEHDLALMRVKDAPPHGIALVSLDDPYVGQYAQTMGHPLGLWFSYSTGVVSGVRRLKAEGMWYVQTTAPISPGNSGGGLFDVDGELLGISHAYFPRGENLNMFVHAQYVRALLAAQGLIIYVPQGAT